VFILQNKTPKSASLHLNASKWSNQRKAALGEASIYTDKDLYEVLKRLRRLMLSLNPYFESRRQIV
jgi:hypothetical protein